MAGSNHSRAAARSPARALRLARVVAGYGLFALGSLLLTLTVVPAIHLATRDRERAERRVQRLLQRAFRFYLAVVERTGIASFRWSGEEALAQPGVLVVANHPTRLDAVALIAAMPQADCIVKPAYFENPFLRHAARAAGYIPQHGGPEVVEACVERLVRGRSVVIFPEGTRSPRQGLAPLHRGASHIALRAGCDVQPVKIRCHPPVLKKDQPWWDTPDHFTLSLEVGAPIAVKDLVSGEPTRARAARVLTRAIRRRLEQE